MAKIGKDKKGKEKDSSSKGAAEPIQMSEEFMKSWQKTYQEASAAAAKGRKEIQSSDEVKKAREEGRKAGEITAGRYECEQIVDKLKLKPAVVSMTYVRDVQTEYKVDGISQKDMELLKKYNMNFPHITKVKTSYPINFRSFGDAYIKRGGSKIPLQKNGKDDPTLIMQDGDIIATGRTSYAFGISDSTTCKPDGWENREYSTDIMLFPESELKVSLKTKIQEPKPSQGDSMVHPATTKTDTISGIELISGLFRIDIMREKRDVNDMVRLPSGYPKIEFRPGMAAAAGIFDDMIDKLKSGKMGAGVKGAVMDQIMAQYMKAKQNIKASTAITDRIYSFIELNNDGSLVLSGGNQIKHISTGKESGRTIKNKMYTGKPIKITATASSLYETDCGKNPDRRVEMIMKKETALISYLSALSTKADLKAREEKIAKGEFKEKYTHEDRMEGPKQALADAEEIGDKELIEMAKGQIKTVEVWEKQGFFQELEELGEKGIRTLTEQSKKLEAESKPILDAPLPPYDPPNAADAL